MCCEQTFSLINFNKNKQCSSLTNGHSENILLKICCSSIEPVYAVLVADKKCNISHRTLLLAFVFTADVTLHVDNLL